MKFNTHGIGTPFTLLLKNPFLKTTASSEVNKQLCVKQSFVCFFFNQEWAK